MGSFHLLYLCLLLSGTSVRGSSLPTSSSSDDTNLDSLENSRDVILMELLRRVKLLEARATLVESVEQNQQTQFESLHNLIKKQEEWICRIGGQTTGNDRHKCSLSDNHVASDPEVTSLHSHTAFTAYLDHDLDLGNSQTIIFNKIILNEGDAYSNITGIFTAPRQGVYDFSFSIGQRDVKGIWVRLFVNDTQMISGAVDTQHQYQDLQGSNRLLVRLQQGDVVFLKQDGGHIEGSDNLRVTTFSGLFLFE